MEELLAGPTTSQLHTAAATGDAGAIRGLLRTAGAPGAAALLRAVDGSGRTPLWLAAAGGHKAAVRLLLRRGADRHAAAADGSLPISCAARQGHVSVVQALVKPAAAADCHPSGGCDRWTAWHWCAHTGDAASARALLSEASWVAAQPIDSPAADGATALMVAAAAGQLDVLLLLLGAGASPLERDLNGFGWTALHHAARHDRAAAVQALIRAGADVNAVCLTEEGFQCQLGEGEAFVTPLHLAAQHAGVDVLRSLIDAGASVSDQNFNGCTAIGFAARGDRLDNISLLLARGADVEVAADGGRAVAEAVLHHHLNGDNGDSAAALLLVRGGAAIPDWNMMLQCVYVFYYGLDADVHAQGGIPEEDDLPCMRELAAESLKKLCEWLAQPLAQPLRDETQMRTGLQELVVGAAAAGRRAQRAEQAAEEAAARTASLRAEAAALEARIAQAEAGLASLPPTRAQEGQGRQPCPRQPRDAAASSAAKKPRRQQ